MKELTVTYMLDDDAEKRLAAILQASRHIKTTTASSLLQTGQKQTLLTPL